VTSFLGHEDQQLQILISFHFAYRPANPGIRVSVGYTTDGRQISVIPSEIPSRGQGGRMIDASIWREAYRKALNEKDDGQLTDAVHAAEGAIFLRSQELDGSADHHAEREEMKAAGADLLAIKSHKLGWPPPKITE
jgi:hypothetical protein